MAFEKKRKQFQVGKNLFYSLNAIREPFRLEALIPINKFGENSINSINNKNFSCFLANKVVKQIQNKMNCVSLDQSQSRDPSRTRRPEWVLHVGVCRSENSVSLDCSQPVRIKKDQRHHRRLRKRRKWKAKVQTNGRSIGTYKNMNHVSCL